MILRRRDFTYGWKDDSVEEGRRLFFHSVRKDDFDVGLRAMVVILNEPLLWDIDYFPFRDLQIFDRGLQTYFLQWKYLRIWIISFFRAIFNKVEEWCWVHTISRGNQSQEVPKIIIRVKNKFLNSNEYQYQTEAGECSYLVTHSIRATS